MSAWHNETRLISVHTSRANAGNRLGINCTIEEEPLWNGISVGYTEREGRCGTEIGIRFTEGKGRGRKINLKCAREKRDGKKRWNYDLFWTKHFCITCY